MFDNLKRPTADKVAHNKRTGVTPKPYTALDDLMMDIEGRDSNKMVGLGLPDNSSQFSTQSNLSSQKNMSNQSFLDISSQSEYTPTVFTNPSTTTGNILVAVAGMYFSVVMY